MNFRLTCFALALSLALAFPAQAQDIVLTGGTIVDGSGGSPVVGNLRISGSRIDRVGTFDPAPGDRVIDVRGLVVAPGFIDLHNHSAGLLDDDLDALSQTMQGITMMTFGLDGEGPILVEDVMARFDFDPPALSVVTFAGHNTVRRAVMGRDVARAATAAEIARMEQLVESAMRQGAFGLSLNLRSGPGAAAGMDEIDALARVVARYGGVYAVRLRNDGAAVVEAVREAVGVGRRAQIPIHISQLRLNGPDAWGRAGEVLAEIDRALQDGIDVTADLTPYDTWEGDLTALLAGGPPAPETVSQALAAVGGPENVVIVAQHGRPERNLLTLARIAADLETTPIDAYLQIVRDGGARAVFSSMSEADIRTLVAHPAIMIASDGGLGERHPKGVAAFPRALAAFVRDGMLLSLEEAVFKMSAFPARRLGLRGRGVLDAGGIADIAVFDPQQIRDAATVYDWNVAPEGMKYVFVDGVAVIENGAPTGERPGGGFR